MHETSTTHERCWDDIPWWVNGTLPEVEQQRLAEHVEQCEECREELARQQRLFTHLHVSEAREPFPKDAWEKLQARIDASSPVTAAPANASSKRRWLQIAVWAQAAVIAALATALLLPVRPAEYVTLTSVASSAPRGAIRVVFAPDASLEAINQLLHGIDGEVIAGPSEAGVYTVRIAAANPVPTIAALRAHREVLFAEATAGTANR